MRRAFLSAALVLATGAPAAILAQETAETGPGEGQLSSAGFENARILQGVEVARVTDASGNAFLVLGGLDRGVGGALPTSPASAVGDPLGTAPATGGEAGAATEMVTGPEGVANNPAGAAEPAEAAPVTPDTAEAAGEGGEDPLAGRNLTEQVQSGNMLSVDLGAQLSAAGIENYEILGGAQVAEVTVGEGQVIHVITGLSQDGGNQ